MPRYLAIVRHSTLESFGHCEKEVKRMIKARLAVHEATEFSFFLPTASLPPVYYALFVVPRLITEIEMDGLRLADGLLIDVRRLQGELEVYNIIDL
ncbi:hypothetical protein BDV38DRAFT_232121, partial [Aspergillus pseudotamarii]